jgi:hypothetical protein
MNEKVRITAMGNVGIGTNSPLSELDVTSTGNNNPGIALNNDQGNAGDILVFDNGDLTSLLRIGHDPNGATLDFQNRMGTPVSRLFIRGDGNVGIGTTNPSSTLDVAGRIELGRQGLVGQYNSAQVQGVWSIGEAYNVDLAANNFGNQYGITYAHTNSGTGTKRAYANQGHQILFTNNGAPNVAISLSTGDVIGSRFRDRSNVGLFVDPASISYMNQIRASFIYDRDNTGFYVDPNSWTRLNKVQTDCSICLGWSDSNRGCCDRKVCVKMHSGAASAKLATVGNVDGNDGFWLFYQC